jgi:hypothetical protein
VLAVKRAALAAAFLAACGAGDDAADPCVTAAGTCLAIDVRSDTVTRIDQLDLDILYGIRHAVAHTQLDGGRAASLPVATSIVFDDATAVEVGVVAGGKLAGSLLGTGAASATLAADEHARVTITLAEVATCQDAAFYCGGDQLAGDPATLYQCDAGAVPQARGRCAFGCTINAAADDECAAGPDTCVEGGFYCGGNKVAGDPRTRYRCTAGAGVVDRVCPDACVIAPPGTDDDCL